jgi:hypothetical protein
MTRYLAYVLLCESPCADRPGQAPGLTSHLYGVSYYKLLTLQFHLYLRYTTLQQKKDHQMKRRSVIAQQRVAACVGLLLAQTLEVTVDEKNVCLLAPWQERPKIPPGQARVGLQTSATPSLRSSDGVFCNRL